jgi:hypothetical protein
MNYEFKGGIFLVGYAGYFVFDAIWPSFYYPPFPFSGGRIIKVIYDLADDQYVDVEKKFAEKLARD